MKCKSGETFDFLTVANDSEIDKKEVLCKCRCGRIVSKRSVSLRIPTVQFKACGHKDCEYSGIKRKPEDMTPKEIKFFEKKRKKQKKEYYIGKNNGYGSKVMVNNDPEMIKLAMYGGM